MKRKPTYITSDQYKNLYIICDDGSMWVKSPMNNWERLPDIPQDNHDEAE